MDHDKKDDPRKLLQQALDYFHKRDCVKMQAALNKAALLCPEDPDLYHLQGLAMIMSDNPAGALSWFKMALSLAPRVPQYHLNMATVARRLGKDDLAREHQALAEKHAASGNAHG